LLVWRAGPLKTLPSFASSVFACRPARSPALHTHTHTHTHTRKREVCLDKHTAPHSTAQHLTLFALFEKQTHKANLQHATCACMPPLRLALPLPTCLSPRTSRHGSSRHAHTHYGGHQRAGGTGRLSASLGASLLKASCCLCILLPFGLAAYRLP